MHPWPTRSSSTSRSSRSRVVPSTRSVTGWPVSRDSRCSDRTPTTIWNEDDFARLHGDLIRPEAGLPPQRRRLHDVSYTVKQFDAVTDGSETVGVAMQSAYVAPDRRFISLALVDEAHAEPGTELTLIWGDSTTLPRPGIEPHRQVPVRVTVAPTPFSDFAREQYRR